MLKKCKYKIKVLYTINFAKSMHYNPFAYIRSEKDILKLAIYLPGVESYLAEKQAMQKASVVEATSEKTVTLTVAECGEFHSLGEFHENIAGV